MHRNTIPFKVAAGYCAVAVVLLLAIALVYSNTKSIFAINHASREYIRKREAADSVMSSLLKAEQANLQQLSEAMKERTGKNYLHEKVESLDKGEDSVVVHPKTPQKVQEKSTVVEVVKTRKGFFRRVADVFRKERADTVSIKVDNDTAVIDTVVTPVNVASNVVTILKQVDRKERVTTGHQAKAVHKEMADLKVINAQLALKSTQQLREVHRRERKSIQQSINQAMAAQRHLLWQMGMLAIVAVVAAVILIGYVWRDNRRERIYRENLEHANEEIQRIMQQRERLLLTITHDIKAPAASISGFIDIMRDYVDQPRGRECLDHIQGSARHLSHLVSSLLDYHQLENGLMEVHPVNFSPSQLLRECVEGHRLKAEEKGLHLQYMVVSEAGASVYSASKLAAEEFPQFDVSLRSAVSIARRLQDPLAELVKIDPKAIGVGQYQHDLKAAELDAALGGVVEDCVNSVGVDVNTASVSLLSYVAGINTTVAKNIVAYREENGAFTTRAQLKKVPRLGPKAFEQCAGFLRINHGDNPLDASTVHPEAYPVVERILAATQQALKDLMGNSSALRHLKAVDFTDEKFGVPTVTDIIKELEKPGRDPRPEFKTAKFADGVETMNDLLPGMILEGAVTNVTNFGAFVDIGVHQDGLVHISSLSDRFVEDPHTVVKAGDIVKVKVMEVDLPRKRIALTMRLDEQPGDSNARRGGGQERPQGNRPAAKAAKPRGREAQPAGNSAMMDALAAAMGKKR